MEEDLDVLEDEVAGLPHLEGEGVAVKPDTDDEEALEEVLDRARAGKQQSTRSTSWSSLQGAQYTHREQILKCKQQSKYWS